MAPSAARRHQMGNRAHDAGSRTAASVVSVQAEEDGESEPPYREALGAEGLGSCRRWLAGLEQRTAVDRMEPDAPSGHPPTTVARNGGRQRRRTTDGSARLHRHGGTEARAESVRIQRTGHLAR